MTERLREIEQRCEKATPGPWVWLGLDEEFQTDVFLNSEPAGEVLAGNCINTFGIDCQPQNQDFIAHAREDIPWLLGVIKEQAEEIQRLKGLWTSTGFEVLESNGEHSEDAKPLDGTVQE